MNEYPILFNSPMVRAIQDGRKTQTRRVVKGGALRWLTEDGFSPEFVADPGNKFSPCGYPGDRLWVRETFYDAGYSFQAFPEDEDRRGWHSLGIAWYALDGVPPVMGPNDWGIPEGFHPDQNWFPMCDEYWWRKHPSIHMPRWACRIVLEVTGVRVERLQDISEADAKAEGADTTKWFQPHGGREDDQYHVDGREAVLAHLMAYRNGFATLWDSLAKTGLRWEDNPWVWAVEFKRVQA